MQSHPGTINAEQGQSFRVVGVPEGRDRPADRMPHLLKGPDIGERRVAAMYPAIMRENNANGLAARGFELCFIQSLKHEILGKCP